MPPYITDLDEASLQEKIHPTAVDWSLRKKLHILIEEAKHSGDKITVTRLWSGTCSSGYFYTKWIQDQYRMAWIQIPIREERDLSADIYRSLSIKVQKFLLKTDVTVENLGEFMRAAKFFAERAHGAATQKFESKNLNATVDLNKPSPVTKEELENKIKELESKMDEKPVIDVTPE